jgi:hypothetical protein
MYCSLVGGVCQAKRRVDLSIAFLVRLVLLIVMSTSALRAEIKSAFAEVGLRKVDASTMSQCKNYLLL